MSELDKLYAQVRGMVPLAGKAPERQWASLLRVREQPEAQVYLTCHLPQHPLPGFWGPELHDLNSFEPSFAPIGDWIVPSYGTSSHRVRVYVQPDSGVAVALPGMEVQGSAPEEGWVSVHDALRDHANGARLLTPYAHQCLRDLARGLHPSALCLQQKNVGIHEIWPDLAVAPLRTPTLPPATRTNTYVLGEEELYIVDPATPHDDERARLVSYLEGRVKRGSKVVAVVLTHHHGDHWGAASHVSERFRVPICAHVLTAQSLAASLEVTQFVTAGPLSFGQGRGSIEVLETPGHADGHLCFELCARGAIVAGDMVASEGTILIDPSEGDMTQYLASLQVLLARDPRLLLPAHGSPITDSEGRLRYYLEHRRKRENLVMAALGDQPQSLDTLVVEVYSDTPVFLHPLAKRSLLAHLLKLKVEGRAKEKTGAWSLCHRDA